MGVLDLNGTPLKNENGKVPLWGYEKESPATVKKSKDTSINSRAEFFLNQQESVAAESDLSLMLFADKEGQRDPITGRIAETTTEAININAKRWAKVKDTGRDNLNKMYAEAYSILMGTNLGMIEDIESVNQQELETSIHIYLNSRGYMRGDKDKKFIPPPVSPNG